MDCPSRIIFYYPNLEPYVRVHTLLNEVPCNVVAALVFSQKIKTVLLKRLDFLPKYFEALDTEYVDSISLALGYKSERV